MIDKYPASLKGHLNQLEFLLIILLQTKTIPGEAEKKVVEENKPKLERYKLSEKDVEVKLLVGKIKYSEKRRSRLWENKPKFE